ncbi:MAG: hypothetical protein FH756_20645 [Firmicutes bacterium]|nr:hypothetical protein [Bacillota bacterium]
MISSSFLTAVGIFAMHSSAEGIFIFLIGVGLSGFYLSHLLNSTSLSFWIPYLYLILSLINYLSYGDNTVLFAVIKDTSMPFSFHVISTITIGFAFVLGMAVDYTIRKANLMGD